MLILEWFIQNMYGFLKDADTNNYSSKTLLILTAAGCLYSVRVHWLDRLSSQTVSVTEWHHTTLVFRSCCIIIIIIFRYFHSCKSRNLDRKAKCIEIQWYFIWRWERLLWCMQYFFPNPYLTSHCGAVWFLLFKAMVGGEGFLLSHYVVFYMWASYLKDSCKEKKKCCCTYLWSEASCWDMFKTWNLDSN